MGIYFAGIQGISTIKSGFINLYQNRLPIFEILSGASSGAAIFLIIPEILTDIVGFLLLIPLTRRILLSQLLKNQKQNKDEKVIEAGIVKEKRWIIR